MRSSDTYGGTVGPENSLAGQRMQLPNEEFFTFFSEARSNIVARIPRDELG